MFNWLQHAIEAIRPLTSKAAGLVKLGEHIAAEIEGNDDIPDKIIAVATDLTAMAHEIASAINANTPTDHASPEPQQDHTAS